MEDDMILELEGGIVVREYRKSDAAACSKHANNMEVWKTLRDRFPHPYTEENALEWIKICQDPKNHVHSGKYVSGKQAEGPLLPTNYVIVVDGEPCGSIGLDFRTDVHFRSAELGYWLGEAYWGKRVMSKVAAAFVKWAWQTFDILIRLDCGAHETNSGSIKVMEKAGFVYEGRRPNAVVKMGQVEGEVLYGALRP